MFFRIYSSIPRRFRAAVAVLSGVVVAAVVVVASVAISLAVGPSASKLSIDCTTYSKGQLPPAVVKTVEQGLRGVDASSDQITAWAIGTRQIDKNWHAEADVVFEAKYCGFYANVNVQSEMNNPPNPTGSWSDHVFTTRHGKAFDPGNDICISNTVPTVRLMHGILIEFMKCDRVYPGPTWSIPSPALPPQVM